jgi:hypothetical protein
LGRTSRHWDERPFYQIAGNEYSNLSSPVNAQRVLSFTGHRSLLQEFASMKQ